MAVNLSARQVAKPGLATAVSEVLTESGLSADLLRLELTETALLRAGHSAALELGAVRNLGVHVGMDDFGTGYASLTNLQQLPIDFLKIDRSFVITLAEGIETEEQAELLREYGCPYGQGFQFARPAPAGEIARLLTTPHSLPPGAGRTAESVRTERQPALCRRGRRQ